MQSTSCEMLGWIKHKLGIRKHPISLMKIAERISITSTNRHEFEQALGNCEDRETWHAAVHGVAKNQP